MISAKAKRNISRIIPFGLIWFVSGMVFFLIETAAAGGLDQLPSTAIEIDFTIFVFGTVANTMLGLSIGAIEVLAFNHVFAKKSLLRKVLYKTLFYTLIMFAIIVIVYPIAASMELNTNILDKQVWQKVSMFLTSYTHLSTDLQLAVQLGISLFYAEISEHIGHGILLNFFSENITLQKKKTGFLCFWI